MKILHVASEVIPFAQTGGLADVVGTLPKVLAGLGHEVSVALPRYKGKCVQKSALASSDGELDLQTVVPELSVPFAAGTLTGSVKKTTVSGRPGDSSEGEVTVYFIERDELFDRDGLYGQIDDPERFVFFSRAVLEMLKVLKWSPDIVHCHDWQTGFIPAYLKSVYAGDPFYSQTASVYTIHNLAYQGVCPVEKMAVAQLPDSMFNYHQLEFYGRLNPMKGGLVFADVVTTVSEKYAQEIQTPDFGAGLENALLERSDSLFGVVNGIDYGEWSPATDTDIAHNYSLQTLTRKAENKRALQKRGDLPPSGKRRIPVIGCVSRLTSQKGFDLIAEIAEEMMALEVQFVLLGAGDEDYTRLFEEMAGKYPSQTYFTLGKFDIPLAHQIYAGADMFLMPSRYEPCGLGQLISMAYGTIPVVRATGGLADTVQEYDPLTRSGTGFRFEEYSAEALLACVRRAVKTYKLASSWKPLVQNALQEDFSWKVSARKYLNLYETARRKKG